MYAGVRPVFQQFDRVQALTTPAGAWPRLNGQKTVKRVLTTSVRKRPLRQFYLE